MCKVLLLPFSCGHRIVTKFDLCDLGPCPVLEPRPCPITAQQLPCMACQRQHDPRLERRPTLSRTSSASSDGSIKSLNKWKRLSILSGPKDPYLNFTCEHERRLSYNDLPKAIPRQKHVCVDCQLVGLRQHIDTEVTAEAERLWPKVRKDRKNKGLPRKEWMAAEAYETFIAEERGDGKQLTFFVMKKWDQDLKSFGVLGGLTPTNSAPSSLSPTPDSASN